MRLHAIENFKILKTKWSELDKLKEILKSIIFASGESCIIVKHEKLCDFIKEYELNHDQFKLHYDIDLELRRIVSGYNNECKLIMIIVE